MPKAVCHGERALARTTLAILKTELGRVYMKTLMGALAVAFALSCTAAIAQTPRQLKSERFAKQAECLKQARLQRFRRGFAARNQFMKQCMASKAARHGKTTR